MIPSVLIGALTALLGGLAAMGVDWARHNGRAWLAWLIGLAALGALIAVVAIGGPDRIGSAAIAVALFGFLLIQRSKARRAVAEVQAREEFEPPQSWQP